jgi:hypothetical protein
MVSLDAFRPFDLREVVRLMVARFDLFGSEKKSA